VSAAAPATTLSIAEVKRLQADFEGDIRSDRAFQSLKTLLHEFNLFEALDAVRHELRHSAVLAFLLHSGQSHGLGDAFLRHLLHGQLCRDARTSRRVLAALRPVHGEVSAQDFRAWRFEDAVSLREIDISPGRIDVMVVDAKRKLVIVLENKIDSTEHDDQLTRYRVWAQGRYPDHALLCLYLSPKGDKPSDDAYLAVDYEQVCRALEAALKEAEVPAKAAKITARKTAKGSRRDAVDSTVGSAVSPDIHLFLHHYHRMLRRHLMEDLEVKKLCDDIYAKHSILLEAIFTHRIKPQSTLVGLLMELVDESKAQGLLVKDDSLTFPKFTCKEWDRLTTRANGGKALRRGALHFEFDTRDSLRLSLVIGPYAPSPEPLKKLQRQILHTAIDRQDLLTAAGRFAALGAEEAVPRPNATTLWSRPWLARAEYKGMSDDEREARVRQKWGEFALQDLPGIRAVFANLTVTAPRRKAVSGKPVPNAVKLTHTTTKTGSTRTGKSTGSGKARHK